jgi:hypothetical protein
VRTLEDRALLLLVVGVSLAFAWILDQVSPEEWQLNQRDRNDQ